MDGDGLAGASVPNEWIPLRPFEAVIRTFSDEIRTSFVSVCSGSATRYQRPQLLRLVAARRLLTAERLTLIQIRGRIQAMSETDVETFATEALAPGPLADALGVRIPAAAVSAVPGAVARFNQSGMFPV